MICGSVKTSFSRFIGEGVEAGTSFGICGSGERESTRKSLERMLIYTYIQIVCVKNGGFCMNTDYSFLFELNNHRRKLLSSSNPFCRAKVRLNRRTEEYK